MAGISILAGFSYKGKQYDFTRQGFKTLSEMASYSENYLPPLYMTFCEETGMAYMYNKNNTADPETGKWREFNGGGEGAVYTGQQNTSACKVVTFDASHSNASIDINGNNVYTNNGETRPANVRLNYIIKAKQVAVPTDFADSLVGYVGQETNYNLYSWSNTTTSANPVTYLDFTVEKDGWYSVDFTLEQSDGDVNGFAIRDFDAQGETHTIGRGEIKGCIRYRSNIIVPLKAGMYRYQHNGVGSLSVYMNRRDFA